MLKLHFTLGAHILGCCVEIITLNVSMDLIDLCCMNSSSSGLVGYQRFKTLLPKHHVHFILCSGLLNNVLLPFLIKSFTTQRDGNKS